MTLALAPSRPAVLLRARLVAGLLLAAAACQARPPAGEAAPEGELWIASSELELGTARVVEVRERELARTVPATGRVAFDDARVAHLFPPLAGRVTRVLAGLGQRVEPGAPLLALASPDAAAAFADVAKAEADLTQAAAELQRQRRLVAAGAAPQRDLVAAEDARRKAEAERSRARERAALLRPAGARAGHADGVTGELVLRSPIRGEVLARAAAPGLELQGASSGSAIEVFTVGDISRVLVLADVAEPELPRVRPGADAAVRVAAWPGRSFHGTVELVAASLDPATRTGRVRIAVDNPDHALAPEMLATVAIASPPRRGLSIPAEALLRLEGETFAWVAAGDAPGHRLRFRRQRLQVEDGAPEVLVAGGLRGGERILVEHGGGKGATGDVARVTARQLQAAGIRVMTAGEHDVPDELELGGRIAFDDLRVGHVFSPVGGRVARVLAQPGQEVKRGAPLLTLLSPEVGSAVADAAKADAELVAARHERDRQRELLEAHAGARRDLEAAEAALARASAEAARARQKTALLRAGDLDAAARAYTVRSPIDGVVVSRAATPGLEVPGQWSGAGAPVELFTIGALDPLWVVGQVYEMDLPQVKRGQPVTVRVPAHPERTFHGRVEWVSKVLDPATRTAEVRCTIANPDRLLRPEMAPVLSLSLPAHRRLALPRRAVLRLGDDTVVFVAAGTGPDGVLAFQRRKVVVGEDRPGGLVPVVDGVVPGESVVVQGAVFLSGLL